MDVAPEHVSMTFVLIAAFVIGISFGSFVTMASWRMPMGEDTTFKPSYCPKCNHSLTALELFPLLSWAVQGGRCRSCRAVIHWRYPLIEATCGLIFVLLAYLYGPTLDTVILALFACELGIMIVSDLEHYIIPDAIQLALGLTGIVHGMYLKTPWQDMAISASIGLALGLTLHYGYLLLRKKDGLGWGDVKFLFVAGIWLPVITLVPFLFLAGVIGTLTGLFWRVSGRGAIFPFGPALALSLFINVLIPHVIQFDPTSTLGMLWIRP